MRFSHIVMAYFIIGTVMWAGGAIPWSGQHGGVGMATLIIDNPETGDVNSNTTEQLENTGGPIQEAITAVGGGALIAVWNLVVQVIGFFFWPISALANNGAPPRVWVPLGGVPTIAFYGAFIRLIRTSG